jgi:phosphate transport system substrate-binding protein
MTAVKMLPMTAGSIVLSYHVPGVSERIRLSRKAYLRIFLSEITSWNDPEIVRHNPGIDLPDLPITVVTRADSSGTTYAFTNHLSAVGEALKVKWTPGAKKSVKWKESINAQGNDGVAALIQLTPGAIGYLEYGYADLAQLPMAALEDRAGKFIVASQESGLKALVGATIPPDLQVKVPDPPGEDAYPIVTFTWVLCRGRYTDANEVEALKRVLLYCVDDGQKLSAELGYLPLPADVAAKVKATIQEMHASP